MYRSEYQFSVNPMECWRSNALGGMAMTGLDQHVEAVVAMLRARGGIVHLDLRAPDYVKRAFLQLMMECKDCREIILGDHDGCAN